jgi:steroid delta-isomerase-like uncharacterized protein
MRRHTTSSTNDNKEVVGRYFETIWNRGEFDREAEFVAQDCIVHAPPIPGIPDGIAGPLTIVKTFRDAVPDLRLTNVLLVAADDRVVQRWVVHGTHTGEDLFGVPPSNVALVLTGINEFRIEDGKIAERWGTMDVLGMLQQLGVVPDPMQSPPPDDATETETRPVGDYTISATEEDLGRRSHMEFLSQGQSDVVDEIYTPDVVIYGRSIPPDWRHGTEGFKSYGQMLRTAFPDMETSTIRRSPKGTTSRSAGRSTGRTRARCSGPRRRERRSRSRGTTSSETARPVSSGSSRTCSVSCSRSDSRLRSRLETDDRAPVRVQHVPEAGARTELRVSRVVPLAGHVRVRLDRRRAVRERVLDSSGEQRRRDAPRAKRLVDDEADDRPHGKALRRERPDLDAHVTSSSLGFSR